MKNKNTKIAKDENLARFEDCGKTIKVESNFFSFLFALLVVSVLFNLFFFTSWLIFQLSPGSRAEIIALLF